jgi:hypothetical protein
MVSHASMAFMFFSSITNLNHSPKKNEFGIVTLLNRGSNPPHKQMYFKDVFGVSVWCRTEFP